MSEPEPSGPEPGVTSEKRRFHWHVYLTHFPISLFGAAFGFQILHLFMAPACFELATNVALIGGTATLLPAIISGWYAWKAHYHGASGVIFKRKIVAAFAMAFLSVPLVVWRVAALGVFQEARQTPAHWVYLAGNTLLILGAIVEGYYGGRLNHR
jgi:uncharacterized membrane protein